VILDSGLGDSYVSWSKVQPQIAKFFACLFVRPPGLGLALRARTPAPAKLWPRELHTLLHNAGISSPYVLVGHSTGGFNVRLFTSLYRGEVAGMVLVDSSHPEQDKRFPQALNDMDKTWVREQEFSDILDAIRNSATAGLLW